MKKVMLNTFFIYITLIMQCLALFSTLMVSIQSQSFDKLAKVAKLKFIQCFLKPCMFSTFTKLHQCILATVRFKKTRQILIAAIPVILYIFI